MKPTKTVVALTFVLASVLASSGCAGTADTAPQSTTSSTSASPSSAEPSGELLLLNEEPDLDELADGQFGDFVSVLDYPTLHDDTVESFFENSPIGDNAQVITHDDVVFNAVLQVVANQRPIAPNLGAKADEPKQPEGSPMRIGDAGNVVDAYFGAAMNAMETGDPSQLGKIAWEHCDLCNDTKVMVEEATDPKTYESSQIYYGGLVVPSSALEFVKTDGMFYHFKTSAVERTFYSNLVVDPWIMRGDDAGKFVMDIVVAETGEGWKMVFYDVTAA